jgi:hypothetical protein
MNSTTLFYTILAVAFSLIAFAIYLLLKPKKEAPKEQTTKYDVLNYQEKERLEELNVQVEKHQELAIEPINKINELTIGNLKRLVKLKEERIEYLNKAILQRDEAINQKNIEIKRLKEESQKTPTNFDFNYKVGDVVKGRIIPNGKKYVKGTIVRITRRENLVLDNGKTVDKVDARIVFNS